MRIKVALCDRCGLTVGEDPPDPEVFDGVTYELCDYCHRDINDALRPVARAHKAAKRRQQEERRRTQAVAIRDGWANSLGS